MVEVAPALPTLGRSCARHDNGGFFLLCRPGRLAIKPDGGSTSVEADAATVIAALLGIVLVTIWALSHADPGVGGWIAALISGILFGGLAVLPLFALLEYLNKGRERRRPEVFARVTRKNELAWQMCETVHQLVTCRAWLDRTVDPQRRIPVLLWAAVQRSMALEVQREAVFRARSHPSLDDLARDAAAKAEQERAALVTVAENLRAIRDAATKVDRTRTQRAQQQQAARDKQIEERRLRSTLLGTTTSAAPELSEHRADAAAGLAAEAETIAVLLADTDRLLHS